MIHHNGHCAGLVSTRCRIVPLRAAGTPARHPECQIMHDLESARRQMIDHQVRAWEVLDPRVLDTLAALRREHYVPEAYCDVAFADMEIPLGHGQCMLAPKLEGRILQAVAAVRTDDVLEVGTGSGFFAACLAHLAGTVRSLEIHGDLAQAAARNLRAAAVTNVQVENMDALCLAEQARYDVIAITAALPVYDTRFEKMLRTGGRLFAAVGAAPAMQALLVTRADEEQWVRTPLFETVITPLIGAATPPRFEF